VRGRKKSRRPLRAAATNPEILLLDLVNANPLHNALDAYVSAWVAALDPHERSAFGSPPDDVIWVLRVPTSESMVPQGTVGVSHS
jgi:hypothetical protein